MSHQASTTREDVSLAILAAAERLFERYGYRKTTVEEIAEAAEIGKGSIYLHYKSKEEVALAWVDALHGKLREQLTEITHGSGPPLDRVKRFLTQRVLLRYDLFMRHRRSMDEALESLKPRLLERRDAFHESEAHVLALVLEDAGADEPLRMARSMIVATNSLLPYSLRPDQLGDRRCVEDKVADLSDLLAKAVAR